MSIIKTENPVMAGDRAFMWADADRAIWEVDVLFVHKDTALVIGRSGAVSRDVSSLFPTAEACRNDRAESLRRYAQGLREQANMAADEAEKLQRLAPRVKFRSVPVSPGDLVRVKGRPEVFRVCSGNLDNAGEFLVEPAQNPGAFALMMVASGRGTEWEVSL